MRGLAWQRRNIGAADRRPLQDRASLGSRAALWFVRIVGALILLGGAIAGIEALKGGGA